jgi:DNA-binding PadR family transcriptional regulator
MRAGEIEDREIRLTLIQLYILNRASSSPVHGPGVAQDMGEHGLNVSTASAAQILRVLHSRGYLQTMQVSGRGSRKTYRATALGRAASKRAMKRIRNLYTTVMASSSAGLDREVNS